MPSPFVSKCPLLSFREMPSPFVKPKVKHCPRKQTTTVADLSLVITLAGFGGGGAAPMILMGLLQVPYFLKVMGIISTS